LPGGARRRRQGKEEERAWAGDELGFPPGREKRFDTVYIDYFVSLNLTLILKNKWKMIQPWTTSNVNNLHFYHIAEAKKTYELHPWIPV
jgi:hypothetical protein